MQHAEWEMPFEPVYHANGFDFPLMPVMTGAEPNKVQAYRWGLIPSWTGTLADADKLRTQTLNARGETIFTKPAYRSSVQQRCLVLADGFFEWMEFGKKKYPHLVQLKDESVFAFAGLYSHWTDKETGEVLRSFTIITTDANPLMARIHNTKQRMPVVLPQALWNEWLQPELTKEQIAAQLRPIDDSIMEGFPISKRITTRGVDTNVPEVRERVDYPELAFA
ncbi:SOS response-associated peptidase [Pseudocnuella soli]|uniref:SOS response-associated peptidase n=1 Tax=Pseudocnuella soli TaxID=2502779 RepID=UPI0014044FAC|nr:SOS response-associated peptidase [Pseudocnuella soli]